MVEQVGSGIGRIRALMEERGLPAPEFQLTGFFSVVLRRKIDFQAWLQIWAEQLSEKRLEILIAIHQNPTITKSELGKMVNLSSTAVDNNLSFLRNLNLLERFGTKGGRWYIKYNYP